MTTQHAFHIDRRAFENDPIEEQALDIVVRLLSGETTVADGAAIRGWCAEGAANRAAFGEALRIWRGFAQAAGGLAEAPVRTCASPPARTPQSRRRDGPLARGRTVDAKKSRLTLRKAPPRSV